MKITIDRAVVEQALHVATGAGYPVALIAALKAALAEPQEPPIGKASTDVGVPVYVLKKAEPVQEPQEHLLQQALEALLMMRDRYGEYACPACDHADAAVYALKDALAEEALQRLTDVQQEIEAALAAPEQEPCNPSCAPGYCYCEPVEPVAQVHPNHLKPTDDGKPWCREVLLYSGDHNGDLLNGENYRVKLFTTPPQRKPLTEEELKACLPPDAVRVPPGWLKFARAIEVAHGIKEGT